MTKEELIEFYKKKIELLEQEPSIKEGDIFISTAGKETVIAYVTNVSMDELDPTILEVEYKSFATFDNLVDSDACSIEEFKAEFSKKISLTEAKDTLWRFFINDNE